MNPTTSITIGNIEISAINRRLWLYDRAAGIGRFVELAEVRRILGGK